MSPLHLGILSRQINRLYTLDMMMFMAGDGVDESAHAYGVAAGDAAALAISDSEIAEEVEIGFADGGKFIEEIGEGTCVEVAVFHIGVLIEAGQFGLIATGKA